MLGEQLFSRKMQSKSLDHRQFVFVFHGHDYSMTVAVKKGQSLQRGMTCKAALLLLKCRLVEHELEKLF